MRKNFLCLGFIFWLMPYSALANPFVNNKPALSEANTQGVSVLTGIIKPVSSVEMSVAISGVVKQVYKKEGADVKQGELVLKIDDAVQALEVEKYRLQVENTASIEMLKKQGAFISERIAVMRKLMRETGSVSKEELKTLQLQKLNNDAELATARELRKQEQVVYEIAQKKLDQHKLVSPINGVISDIEIQEGEWADSGKVIVKIIDDTACYLETYVGVDQVQTFERQPKVSVLIDQGGETVHKKGLVTFISPIADQASELVRTKILFDNADRRVVSGTNAKISFE